MPCLEKVEQVVAGQIICEQMRANLDKIEQVVAGPINVELAVAGLVKSKLAAGSPEIDCFIVLFCALRP